MVVPTTEAPAEPGVSVAALIDGARATLTPAERRVGEVVLTNPEAIAFGTVAEIASLASTSGATVVRLAAKLGLDGFTSLQNAVQGELANRLRPAAQRIRETQPTDVVGRVLQRELDNVVGTLDAVRAASFEMVVAALADVGRHVRVLAADASRGIGLLLADELAMLRPGVSLLRGPDVRIARDLASVEPGDPLLVIDHRRYDRWVLDTATVARDRGAEVVALCDSALSPLADLATAAFVVRAGGIGPFDSHVGSLALVNALVAAVAARLRRPATERLDRIEAAWRDLGALIDG
jgi:DNA-binding MurR/RpiR family transcriptional regulator